MSDAERAGKRRVVADSSPLIGLATVGSLDLLRELFGRVLVTRAVVDEVVAGGSRPGADELTAAMREGWIRVAPTPMATWRLADLDVGEASTIALALAQGDGALVLMDDVLGRRRAAELELELADVAGLLLAAKRAGLVADVRTVLEQLARKGFTVSEQRVHDVLEQAGETEGA